jgi:F-type H+-transporting ATPase subunit epsilon
VAEGKLTLEIVTPKGRALTTRADEVTAPSHGGEFGVMPGHIPVLAALRTGIVTYRQGSDTKRCAVSTGFVEVDSGSVLLLTDDYAEKDQIDPVLVKQELKATEQAFEKASGADALLEENEAERRMLITKLNWLATQLELYGEPPLGTIRLLEEFGIRRQAGGDVADATEVVDDAAPATAAANKPS